MTFKDCLEEFEDLCTFCAVPDMDGDFDFEIAYVCKYDDQKKDDSCPGFECGEQCRLCDPACEYLGKMEDKKDGD